MRKGLSFKTPRLSSKHAETKRRVNKHHLTTTTTSAKNHRKDYHRCQHAKGVSERSVYPFS